MNIKIKILFVFEQTVIQWNYFTAYAAIYVIIAN